MKRYKRSTGLRLTQAEVVVSLYPVAEIYGRTENFPSDFVRPVLFLGRLTERGCVVFRIESFDSDGCRS